VLVVPVSIALLGVIQALAHSTPERLHSAECRTVPVPESTVLADGAAGDVRPSCEK